MGSVKPINEFSIEYHFHFNCPCGLEYASSSSICNTTSKCPPINTNRFMVPMMYKILVSWPKHYFHELVLYSCIHP